MEKKSKFNAERLEKLIDSFSKKGAISKKFFAILHDFMQVYAKCVNTSDIDGDKQTDIFASFIESVASQCEDPYTFQPFHKQIRSPIDYLQFGVDFMKPLIDSERSKAIIEMGAQDIKEKLAKGENVIFFANHQVEADPQVIFSLIGDLEWPKETIFVAGERVVLDPLAIPFSLGCNLLCIYSKKYINTPSEKREEKLQHNRKTMEQMCALLEKGGASIWVAPSGGRDRADSEGTITPAPFDPQSIEMFLLMAKKAKTPTSFYPLSLYTYHMLPPPDESHKGLGERRAVKRVPVGLHIGDPIDLRALSFPDLDKQSSRQKRTKSIYQIIRKNYTELSDALNI